MTSSKSSAIVQQWLTLPWSTSLTEWYTVNWDVSELCPVRSITADRLQSGQRMRSPWGKLKPITKLWQQWTALKQGPMLYAEQLYCYIFVSFLWGFIQAIVFINHKCDSRLDTYEHLHKCAVNDVFFHTTNPSLTSGYGCKVILLSP